MLGIIAGHVAESDGTDGEAENEPVATAAQAAAAMRTSERRRDKQERGRSFYRGRAASSLSLPCLWVLVEPDILEESGISNFPNYPKNHHRLAN